MTLDVKGDLSRPSHQEILKEKHKRANHVIDVLPICFNIMAIGRHTITRSEYEECTSRMAILQTL